MAFRARLVVIAAVALACIGAAPIRPAHVARAYGPVAPENSFSSQNGRAITPIDIDHYIDPDVVGAKRKLAEELMSIMPPTRRGDFLYVGKDGTVLSNRDAVVNAYLHSLQSRNTGPFGPLYKTRAATHNSPASPRSVLFRGRVVPLTAYPPPITTNDHGPYFREYSTLGTTSAFGFVTVPCGDERFNYGDAGFTYFGENGYSGGQTEGGLQTLSKSGYYDNLSIALYARNGAGYLPVTYPQNYECGSPIELVYGQLPDPNRGMFYTSASIPQYTPTYYNLPGGTVISNYVSYVFQNLPSDFYQPGYDNASGAATPCTSCYMRRMDAIAQQSYNPYSGECFGLCNGALDIRWDQVFMGQTTFYSNTPQLITINLAVSTTAWFGGLEFLPDANAVQSSPANYNQPDNFDFEGINLNGGTLPYYPTAAKFTIPLNPLPLTVTETLHKECTNGDPYNYGTYRYFPGQTDDFNNRTVPAGHEYIEQVQYAGQKICNYQGLPIRR